jgi:hypothetical protein
LTFLDVERFGSFGFGDVECGELRKSLAAGAMATFDRAVRILDDRVPGSAVGISSLDVPRHDG